MKVYKALASVMGVGYVGKGGGTIAALLACAVWYFLHPSVALQLILIAAITVTGIYTGNKVEKDWNKDSPKVVIDEVAGMFLSLLCIPVIPVYIITGLVIFRFFDILKPLYIRRTEKLPGGWGVMLDDLLAGVYANIILQLIVQFNLFN